MVVKRVFYLPSTTKFRNMSESLALIPIPDRADQFKKHLQIYKDLYEFLTLKFDGVGYLQDKQLRYLVSEYIFENVNDSKIPSYDLPWQHPCDFTNSLWKRWVSMLCNLQCCPNDEDEDCKLCAVLLVSSLTIAPILLATIFGCCCIDPVRYAKYRRNKSIMNNIQQLNVQNHILLYGFNELTYCAQPQQQVME